jgi:hypothetical protein
MLHRRGTGTTVRKPSSCKKKSRHWVTRPAITRGPNDLNGEGMTARRHMGKANHWAKVQSPGTGHHHISPSDSKYGWPFSGLLGSPSGSGTECQCSMHAGTGDRISGDRRRGPAVERAGPISGCVRGGFGAARGKDPGDQISAPGRAKKKTASRKAQPRLWRRSTVDEGKGGASRAGADSS